MRIYSGLILFCLASLLMLTSCGGDSSTFEKSPVDEFVKKYEDAPNYSIILHDMRFVEKQDEYQHQYHLVIEPASGDTVIDTVTQWYPVSPEFFESHVNHLGMEIVSKNDGKVEKVPAPPGYNAFVGNEKYGRWQQQNGNSFWQFYGQWAFMNAMFNMMAFPARQSYWRDYHQGYRPAGRTYYGPTVGGRRAYGTNSRYTSSARPSATWNSYSPGFQQRIRSRVQQSASRARTTRSSNRWGSGLRSRGGGFGK